MDHQEVAKLGVPGLVKKAGAAVVALALALGVAGGYAAAQDQDQPRQRPFMGRGPMGRGGPGGPGGLAGLPLGRLDLTEAQRQQVRSVLDAHRADAEALGKRMLTARQALDAAIAAESFDEATVRARSAELAAVEADAAVQRARVYQDVFRLLTPEQQAEAKQFQTRDRSRAVRGPRGR